MFGFDSKEKESPELELPKQTEKTDAMCVEEGCFELKAPAQTYLCAKHMRSN
jgi:hypothetical protein